MIVRGRRVVGRRQFVRASALATAAVVFPGVVRRSAGEGGWPAAAHIDRFRCGIPTAPEAVSRSAAQVETFAQPLRVPPVLIPTDSDATTDVYDVEMRAAEIPVLPGTTTSMWTYDGEFPGPTFVTTRGRQVVVRQRNSLHVPTTVHLHGGHVPALHDGHPDLLIAPREVREYRYPNTQPAATLWYHDHLHHQTADSVYRGLAGLYLVTDPDEDALGLPSGERDLPLVLTDRAFTEDGELIHPPHDGSSFFGDTVLVNGVPHPYVDVEAARYRLRILNGSNSRAYRLSLSNGDTLTRIGSDGGLLAAPVETGEVTLYPAERVEVIVDFRGLTGTSVVLQEAFGAWDGVVRFDVTSGAADNATVPSTLRAIEPVGPPSVTREIVMSLDRRSGLWVLDGRIYDGGRIDQYPKLGATEVWRFHNASQVEHPMHPHLVMFQVVARNDDPPRPGDEGWKDTVLVPPGESVDVAMRFEDHIGRFVYHCHNLEHEDRDMMAQFRVVDLPRLAGKSRIETAVAITDARFAAPVPVAYIATARDFPDALAAGPAAGAQGGALLLTEPDHLPAASAAALDRLQPQRIVVLGGEAAVSRAVQAQLADHTSGAVTRLAGDDRYQTAARVSATYAEINAQVYVASGLGFADALVGGAAAAARGAALLLTDPGYLPDATVAALERIQPSRIVLLGGAAAVGPAVEAELRRYGPVDRLSGGDRYATAGAVVADAFPGAEDEVVIATGASFPDALAGTPAAVGSPLLLVAPDEVPGATAEQLERLRPRRIVVLGGPGAISLGVEDQLASYLPD
ncbi:MAG TPA: cell wall-binding repeat-containing protein [Nitriliruptorales bacterium]